MGIPLKKALYRSILCAILLSFLLPVSAEKWEDPPSLRERLFFGGNFGLQFGSTTSVLISPIAGYRITPRLSGGVGIRYEYFRYNYPGSVPFDTHIYGGSLFTRYTVIKSISEAIGFGSFHSGLFLHAEYEMLSLENQYFDLTGSTMDGRFNLHTVLVGGGVYMPIGSRSGFLISVLWNLNESYNSIYANPVIRFGFTF